MSKLTKIGFVVESLGPNQLAYQLIRSANQLLMERDDFDIILYYRNLSPLVMKPNFAIMNMYEAFRPDSPLVATDLNTATRILDYFTLDRYFYIWDLEHTKMNRSYEDFAQIYQNPKLKLITRSKQHFDIIQLTWGITPIGIVEDARIEKFLELINAGK